ncbi:unnamed protein product [Allacma fusca]|uniref:Scavenger receptor class B member 1 n=1 Tax=Allacma fusca TaxID=39272 RepID=A0A8J2JK34_9HEXA|nr:unnamed protein product [Allacma fusca]
MCHRKCLSVAGLIFGTVLIILVGIIGWIVMPIVVDNHIKEASRLTNPKTLELWENIDVPIQIKFYIFNVTNPGALLENKKFNFEEHGPYVYNVKKSKKVKLSQDKITATYREINHYYFDARDSTGTEDDVFNIPNVPLIALAHGAYASLTADQLDDFKILLTYLVGNERLIKENVTVREILFEGWELPSILDMVPEKLKPETIKGGKFGFYKNKNGSDTGEYVVLTGDKNHEEFGHIVSWEGMEELEWWYTNGLDKNSSDHFCNKINGSDGSIFPPFITKDTTLRMFIPDMCRSVWLTYHSDSSYHTIPAYRFKFPWDFTAGPTCNKNNKCFCQKQHQKLNHHCWSGTSRLFTCKQGAPIVTSLPHFMNGDDELFEAIEMTKPDLELHDSHLEIEPLSGIVLNSMLKLQLNVELQNLPEMEVFKDLNFTQLTESPSILLPIMWMDNTHHLDTSHTKELRMSINLMIRDIIVTKWVLLVVGGLIIFASANFLIVSLKRTDPA